MAHMELAQELLDGEAMGKAYKEASILWENCMSFLLQLPMPDEAEVSIHLARAACDLAAGEPGAAAVSLQKTREAHKLHFGGDGPYALDRLGQEISALKAPEEAKAALRRGLLG